MMLTRAIAALSVALFCGISDAALGSKGSVPGRNLEQTRYCNFIGCPNGFQPIEDAQNTVCNSDPCSVDQCCQAFCSSFPCPNGFVPIEDAAKIRCTDDYCTKKQCCDAFCSGFPCPNGFVPIRDAHTTLCKDQICTADQCCMRGY